MPIPDYEYRILATVLNHGLSDEVDHVVIADTTTGDPTAVAKGAPDLAALAQTLEVPPAALADWKTRNARRVPLARSFPLKTPYTLLSAAQLATIFDGRNPAASWRKFRAAHPHSAGLVRVSRVGFDPQFADALVYVEFECGAACGSGRLVHMKHNASDQWDVVSGELLWIAGDRRR